MFARGRSLMRGNTNLFRTRFDLTDDLFSGLKIASRQGHNCGKPLFLFPRVLAPLKPEVPHRAWCLRTLVTWISRRVHGSSFIYIALYRNRIYLFICRDQYIRGLSGRRGQRSQTIIHVLTLFFYPKKHGPTVRVARPGRC